jgi:hypothetical protein
MSSSLNIENQLSPKDVVPALADLKCQGGMLFQELPGNTR